MLIDVDNVLDLENMRELDTPHRAATLRLNGFRLSRARNLSGSEELLQRTQAGSGVGKTSFKEKLHILVDILLNNDDVVAPPLVSKQFTARRFLTTFEHVITPQPIEHDYLFRVCPFSHLADQ